jgi:hypothetical protein
MDKATREAISTATQNARKLLVEDFSTQLEGTFDILRNGRIAPKGGGHLSTHQQFQRDKVVAAIAHRHAAGETAVEAVASYVRDAAFTTLNRFVALKMLEASQLVQECVTRGEQSLGYREFCGMAPGLALLPDGTGYRLYVESLFDEFSTEIRVLFDRRDAASVFWPKRQTFEALLTILNSSGLSETWGDDETIGWVYQFFNSDEQRREMRNESLAPRNSGELAVRNQFFTPRYVVQFLVDNTLGRLWLEMPGEHPLITDICKYFAHSNHELIQARPRKDPRDLRILDPACGSGHFLLYSFDLLLAIYEEAWSTDGPAPRSEATGQSLRDDFPDLADLRRMAPKLIVEFNLHGVDIDPRCAQIAALALWLRTHRAWRDFGIAASDRPRLQRTHMVVAEPMSGDAALVDEFAGRLSPPLMSDLFKKMVAESHLAGQLGVLLRMERAIAAELRRARNQFVQQQQKTSFLPGLEPANEKGAYDLSGIDDDQFFHEAEARIIEALRGFAETATGGDNVRRRLFAGDAAQGIALIDLVRTRFDVVLMNPPFGLPISKITDYKALPKDLYCYFVERAGELLLPAGFVGAITSSSFRTYVDYESYRNRFFVAGHVPLVADLGWGVLDGAYVETAAYVVRPADKVDDIITFIDIRDHGNRQQALLDAVQDADHSSRYTREPGSFARLPGHPLLYSWAKEVWDTLANSVQLGSACDAIAKGAGPHAVFYRLRWEVSPSDIGLGLKWVTFVNGGSFSPFRRDNLVLLRWDHDGALVKSYLLQRYPYLDGNTEWNIQMEDHYGRAGLTYGKKTTRFSAQVMPSGCIFSFEGMGVFPSDPNDRLWILAYLNSEFVRSYLNATCGLHKNPPYVRNLPLPEFSKCEKQSLSALAKEGWLRQLAEAQRDERSPVFISPLLQLDPGHRRNDDILADIDGIVDARIGLDSADLQRISIVADSSSESGTDDDEPNADRDRSIAGEAAILSWAVGVALGRFDIRVATGERQLTIDTDPFGDVSAVSPGMLPSGSVPFHNSSGILVDDIGHRDDVVAAVAGVCEHVGISTPDPEVLRNTLAHEFFSNHLKSYSRNRRKAPIYWQISTSGSGYSVWLYAHAIGKDTLFRIQMDFVVPKLAHEGRQLEKLRIEAGGNPNREQRAAIASQEKLIAELQAFQSELTLIAPLWDPHSDDGVIINCASLWRLMPRHKGWQRDLRGTWNSLCEGGNDWTHLAMHLWPERVVRKCATDRSLALSHGLEDVFWLEGDDGRWKPRASPKRPVDELVRERTSAAVKAALQALTAASAAPGSKARTRRSSS